MISFSCKARGLYSLHKTRTDACKFFKSFDRFITIYPESHDIKLKKPSKAEPSVPSYGKVIYDGVICNTFKACITLLFIS